ncbi:hypothetical protein PISMIDRAFT_466808 [Pisolithus microcarpus 441]|uniref:Uncharacterized protein n=1 Tax=Pisolithus microcarpus 441 TaxID=765257 RepID=A0A0C9XSU2_9AGAM|nr:hypothetical protein BKA83DRAFT_322602 [Pisolithus microcarpus]KIK15380.1 hypothetical protein PISMIDRAFT_322602 [Pisolithus microcarpus 441]KIK23292.1 hypothetical protein PISMIDRAFT_466808 [Pisolithus microcarpus 441]
MFFDLVTTTTPSLWMTSSDCFQTFPTITSRPAQCTRTSSRFLLRFLNLPESVSSQSLPVPARGIMFSPLSSHRTFPCLLELSAWL